MNMTIIKLSVTQAELNLVREALLEKYRLLLEEFSVAENSAINGSSPTVVQKPVAKKRGRPAGSTNKARKAK
jgi:hypothetical protein